MNEVKRNKPIVYRIYDYLKENHVGKDNAISGADLSRMFNIDRRTLRSYVHDLRENLELSKIVLTCNMGYYVPTAEEGIGDINRLYSQAYSLLSVARRLERKAGLEGQGKIKLGKYYDDFVEAFGTNAK